MTTTSRMPEPRAPERTDLSRLAGLKLGNYRLERLIGRGRMGVVYLATDEALLRPTAVKVLAWTVAEARGHDPVQWFLAEARLVARINDPRVVQVYGAARHGDYCYIAMEYVAGASAEGLVARGPLAPRLATDVVSQAAAALHAAHRSGVVHRDVKPANLLVGPGGVTKLGDFGMALGSAGVGVGNANARVGTPFYTAPEVWRGGGASAASDIYSLGATYFHLLAGRPPYPGADVAAVEQAHLRAPVPDPRQLVPSLPESCAALVRRALAKSPQERHPSALELLWEARRVLQELDAAGAAAPAPRRPRAPDAGGEPAGGSVPGEPPPAAALGREQVEAYLRARLAAAHAPGKPAPVPSRDALLLVAFRSQGIPERIDLIAGNMLLLAAAERSGTLTSWHAWMASGRERWAGALPPAGLPRRPERWPTAEALRVIDACRREAGLPAWPRREGG